MKKINERLKDLRNARGLTTRALADMIGSNNSNITRIEQGKLQPRLDTLIKLCDALGAKLIIIDKTDGNNDNDSGRDPD